MGIITIAIHDHDDKLVDSAQQVSAFLLVRLFYHHVRAKGFEECPHFGLGQTWSQLAEGLSDG
jgi:hypothetical protein